MDSSQDEKANNDLQEFMRKQIRSTVKDPTVAEKLCPYNFVLCKRPVVAQDYFETFNRSNVTLIPITGSKLYDDLPLSYCKINSLNSSLLRPRLS